MFCKNTQQFSSIMANQSTGLGTFPCRLQQILTDCEDGGHQDIASWLPCGTLFKIHDPQKFARVIMPQYFRHSRFKSFLRQLSMYKFQRVTGGAYGGAYGHPQFLRGRKDLCCKIHRGLKSKGPEEEAVPSSPIRPDLFTAPSHSMKTTSFVYSCDRDNLSLDVVDGALMSPEDLKFLQHTISWISYSSTPDDILDEIIVTFTGPKPSVV
jgi:hypothetical protein